MEVFRPLVDISVFRLSQDSDLSELSPEVKASLAAVLERPVEIVDERQKLGDAASTIAHSFVDVCSGKYKSLRLPDSLIVDED